MATFLVSNTYTSPPPLSTLSPRGRFPRSNAYPPPRITFSPQRKNTRGLTVITRAGPPSTNTYVIAFVFPLTLLAITVFTSIRIADKLDEKYLEELEINEAIREADEEEEDDDSEEGERDDENVCLEEEVLPDALQRSRTRSRPKKELIDSV